MVAKLKEDEVFIPELSICAEWNGKIVGYALLTYVYIGDLIEDTKIDALHSFEDQCCPVINYKKKYGSRIGIIGGVDVDKLCRLNEESLRKYIRNILNVCMEDGRYALGSGNSITNYIPIKNYLIMLEEGFNWRLK